MTASTGDDGRERSTLAPAFGVILAAVGLIILLLPYNTTANLSLPQGQDLSSGVPLHIRCESPALDALHGESGDWLNYSARGRGAVDVERATGSWCTPASYWHGGIGLLLLAAGVTILVRQSNRRSVDDGSDGALPAPPGW